MKNNNIQLIDELELELQMVDAEPEYETNWDYPHTGILLSKSTVRAIVDKLRELENIYNQ